MKNDSPLNIYELIMNNTNLSKEEKIEALEKLKSYTDKKYDDSLRNTLTKKWTGSALEIGSAGIPLGGAGKLGSTLGGSLLKSTLGRKLSQEVGSGAVSGLLSGTVFGAGQGLIDNENLLKTAAEYGASGLLLGAISGGLTGKILQDSRIRNLKELTDKRNDWGIAYRKASNNPELAIHTLLENKQGFVPDAFNKKGIGKVDIVWGKEGKKGYGLAHIAEKRAKEGYDVIEFLNNIPENVNKGKIISKKNQPNISLIKNSQNTSIVKKIYNDKKRNWLLTSFNDYEKIPNNIGRTPDIADDYVGMTPPTYSGKISNSQAVSIIPDKSAAKRLMSSSPLSNISPKEGIHSTSGLAANSFIIPYLKDIFNKQKAPSSSQSYTEPNRYLLKGGIEMNVPDFSDYINPVTGSSKVYSREDIANMSGEEYSKNEAEIFGQIKSIGIPAAKDLESSTLRGDTVYVNSYTRDDGTEVKGYYRSKPSKI